jgi:hypothetical protein
LRFRENAVAYGLPLNEDTPTINAGVISTAILTWGITPGIKALKCPELGRFRVTKAERDWTKQNGHVVADVTLATSGFALRLGADPSPRTLREF